MHFACNQFEYQPVNHAGALRLSEEKTRNFIPPISWLFPA